MPIPNPKKGEKSQDFISRMMSDPKMKSEYPQKQRLAIAYKQLRNCECGGKDKDQKIAMCDHRKYYAANCKTMKNDDDMPMMNSGACLLLNRDFQLPQDGWFHVVPFGEFPHSKSGLMQIIDNEAAELIVNRFDAEKANKNFPGILVDFDHFSQDDGKPSEAAGWIEELDNRDDGIWAQIRWSDVGEQAVKGGRYRMVSPVWKLSDCERLDNARVRPMRIDSVALTNDPNLRGLTPLSNRRGDDAEPPTTRETMDTNYKSMLVNLLGLKLEAEDTQIEDAVALANKRLTTNAQLTKDNEALKAERDTLLNAQVERDLTEFESVISDKETVKANLLKNRADTIKFLQAVKKPARDTTPLHNRNNIRQPEPIDQAEGPTEAQRVRAAKIRNRAQELQKKDNMTFPSAWQIAEREVERQELIDGAGKGGK
jgi:phage I-like protein